MSEQTLEEVRQDELEELFDEELKCQAPHEDPRNLVCSGDVTHRFIACIGPRLVCTTTAKYVERVLDLPPTNCNYCEEPCHAHWRVMPL